MFEKFGFSVTNGKRRCVTLRLFFVKGNIDSANKIYQHIDDRILDYV